MIIRTIILTITLLTITNPSWAQLSPTNPLHYKQPDELSMQSIGRAKLIIPVTGFYRDRNTLGMTILKNASTYETKSRGANIIAYQKTSSLSPGSCPIMNSSSMTKTINNYDTFRGRADIVITFQNPRMAEVAEKSQCFLVRNSH